MFGWLFGWLLSGITNKGGLEVYLASSSNQSLPYVQRTEILQFP